MNKHYPQQLIRELSQNIPYQVSIQQPAYFVSPNGSDKNNGSFERPWKSLEKACNSLNKGDHLYLRKGIYREAINLQVSGISISSYPNEEVIISGRSIEKDERVISLLNIKDQSHIQITGLKFQDLISYQNRQMIIAIFIHGSSNNIYIGHNQISNIKTLSKVGDAHGIAIYGTDPVKAIKHLNISYNQLHNLKLGSSEALAINGNVEYFSVNQNRVHNCDNIGIDIIGHEGKCLNSKLDYARYGVVRRNHIYNIDTLHNSSYEFERNAAGIYVDGGQDINIYDNIVYNSNIGVELASEHSNKSTRLVNLEYNLLYHNHIAGIALGGYDEYRGKTADCYIRHNYLIENDSDYNGNGELWMQHFVEKNVITHNTLKSNYQKLFLSSQSKSSINNEIDFNHFYLPEEKSSQQNSHYSHYNHYNHWIWKGRDYKNFSAYQRASKNDKHSKLHASSNMLGTPFGSEY